MKSSHALALAVFLSACSGSTIFSSIENHSEEKTGEGSAVRDESQPFPEEKDSKEAQAQTPPVQSSPPETYAIPPSTAVIPIPVGGASLTCQNDPIQGFVCRDDRTETSKGFIGTTAWVADESLKAWQVGALTRTSEGFYSIQASEEMRRSPHKISVMILDDKGLFLIDDDVPRTVVRNLVSDPDFESQIGNPKISSSFSFAKGEHSAWTGYRPLSSPGINCETLLSLNSFLLTPAQGAYSNNQWVELMAPCTKSGSQERTNSGISQLIATKPGHWYKVRFSYRSADSKYYRTLAMRFSGINAMSLSVKDANWTVAEYSFMALSTKTEIAFEEATQLSNGSGIQLDLIVVEDYL